MLLILPVLKPKDPWSHVHSPRGASSTDSLCDFSVCSDRGPGSKMVGAYLGSGFPNYSVNVKLKLKSRGLLVSLEDCFLLRYLNVPLNILST